MMTSIATTRSPQKEDLHPLPALAETHRASSHKPRLLLVAHRDFLSDGLAGILRAEADNYLLTCLEPDPLWLNRISSSKPEVLLIHNDVIATTVEPCIPGILQTNPGIRIVVFGKHMGDRHLYSLIRAGAHGYINERMNSDHLKRALQNIVQGKTWIERHVMERFIAGQHAVDQHVESSLRRNINQLCALLTRRETEILRQVIKGLSIKEIADQVHLSQQGVKMHLSKLFRKFNVNNRNQLILAAFDKISPVENLSQLLDSRLQETLRETLG